MSLAFIGMGDVPECAPRLGAPESHCDYAKFAPTPLLKNDRGAGDENGIQTA
jgi:hypothetical protein